MQKMYWRLVGKCEGLAGVFLGNVDKEVMLQRKQERFDLQHVDMTMNVRQRDIAFSL